MKRISRKQVLVGTLSAVMALGCAMPAMAAEGWKQNSTGWWYEYNDGSYVVSDWKQVDGQWYFFNQDGYMVTGWVNQNGTWYFCDASGAMQTGWVAVDGVVYYLNPISDGTKGAMKTGEVVIDGTTYHFNASGANTDGVALPGARFYWNGKAVTLSSSTSGGGSGSGDTNIVVETNGEIGDQIDIIRDQNVGAGKPVLGISEVTGNDASRNQTVKVTFNEETKDTTPVSDYTDAVVSAAEAIVSQDNVKYVSYMNYEMTQDMEPETALGYLELQMEKERTIADLQHSSYTVALTLTDDSVVNYTIQVAFQ